VFREVESFVRVRENICYIIVEDAPRRIVVVVVVDLSKTSDKLQKSISATTTVLPTNRVYLAAAVYTPNDILCRS